MPDYDPLLNRWQSAGVLDAETAARIRAFEAATPRATDLPQETQARGMAEVSPERQVQVAGIA